MKTAPGNRIIWIDAIKGLALLGILLNHLVESFGPGPWFTNPGDNWPEMAERLTSVYPGFIRFLGWLGDAGPGVFIVVSGLTLTLSNLSKNVTKIGYGDFFRKRLLRIYPLYLSVHFITVFLMLVVPGLVYQLDKAPLLLSFLGLRFTDKLFFFINPSWWFIWLIIQLYLVFPFLYKFLLTLKPLKFLAITFAITFLFRAMGLLGYHSNENLYYWMTGIFMGTRLAEFTAGMVLGYYLFQVISKNIKLPSFIQIFIISLGLYTLGFAFQLFYYTTILSNLFVSLGLTGIFYSIYRLIEKMKLGFLNQGLIWIGIYSFGIYLIHQAPLRWVAKFFSGDTQLILSIVVLVFAVIAGWYLEKKQHKWGLKAESIIKPISKLLLRQFPLFLMLVLFLMIIIEPLLPLGRLHIMFDVFIVLIFFISIVIYRSFDKPSANLKLLLINFIFLNLLYALLTPVGLAPVTGIAVIITILLSYLLKRLFKKLWLSFIISFLLIVSIFGTAEYYLQIVKPVDLAKWGEFDALQKHPTRIYGLKPSGAFHLKYNNYDYVLKTNKEGLSGPEIEKAKQSDNTFRVLILGDAFSMPEGLPYEDGYPFLLEKKLNQLYPEIDFQVINGGVTGYGPNEELAQLKELCPVYKPDLVICQVFINEFIEVMYTPEERLKGIGFDPDPLSIKDWIAVNLQITAHASKIIGEVKERISGKSPKWKYRKSLLDYYKREQNKLYSSETLGKLHQVFLNMKLIAEQNNAEFIIIFVPGQVEVSNTNKISYFPTNTDINDTLSYDLNLPSEAFKTIAGQLGIELINLRPALISYPDQPVYFPDSWHWNEQGHRAVTEELVKFIETNSSFRSKFLNPGGKQ